MGTAPDVRAFGCSARLNSINGDHHGGWGRLFNPELAKRATTAEINELAGKVCDNIARGYDPGYAAASVQTTFADPETASWPDDDEVNEISVLAITCGCPALAWFPIGERQ